MTLCRCLDELTGVREGDASLLFRPARSTSASVLEKKLSRLLVMGWESCGTSTMRVILAVSITVGSSASSLDSSTGLGGLIIGLFTLSPSLIGRGGNSLSNRVGGRLSSNSCSSSILVV